MIDEDDAPARLAYTADFRNDLVRVGGCAHHVAGGDAVEGVVIIRHILRVHHGEFDVMKAHLLDLLFRLLQHFRRNVDGDDLGSRRIERQGKPGAHAHFEQFFARLHVEHVDADVSAFVEHVLEDEVVEFPPAIVYLDDCVRRFHFAPLN